MASTTALGPLESTPTGPSGLSEPQQGPNLMASFEDESHGSLFFCGYFGVSSSATAAGPQKEERASDAPLGLNPQWVLPGLPLDPLRSPHRSCPFGDFGIYFFATVAEPYEKRQGFQRSVQGRTLWGPAPKDFFFVDFFRRNGGKFCEAQLAPPTVLSTATSTSSGEELNEEEKEE